MDIRNRNVLLGGAAVAVLVTVAGGVLLGRTVFAPAENHSGEGAEAHAAELGGVAASDEHAGETEEHAEEGGAHADEGGDAGEVGEVVMTEDMLKQSGVVLETLSASLLAQEIVSQATVVSSPDGEAVLTARAAGSISAIRKRLGDPVTRGETIAVVNSPEAAGLAASLSGAKARFDQAKSAFDREKRLFDQGVTARQDLEAAQAELTSAEAEYRRSEAAARAARVSDDGTSVYISSPIAGRITEVTSGAKLGAYVTPDTILFRIADPSKIQIEGAVPLADAGRIAPGDKAIVETPAGGSITATVRSVTPSGSAESRSASVVLAVTTGAENLQPGRFAKVIIRAKGGAGGAGVFVLPDEAVQNIEGQDVVFVRSDEGFDAMKVRTGTRSGGRTEILSGVTAGQVVATRNAFLLKAELGKGAAEHGH
jgi:cobalt-zinc-cadmium efflux system membrane fusion protein